MADASDLSLALEMADRAADLALEHFRRGVKPMRKADGSALSQADLDVDELLVGMVREQRPGDAVLSEESGSTGASTVEGGRRWIFDPIDGTSWFVSGLESWGTHIALEEDGEIVLGVITRPVAGHGWWALRGQGAYRGRIGEPDSGQLICVSDVDQAAGARVMLWHGGSHPLELVIRQQLQWVEPSLDGVMQLAEGSVDLVIDDIGFAWDVAPVVAIVEEAGGCFVDRNGGRSIDQRGGWFSNGRLDRLISALRTYTA